MIKEKCVSSYKQAIAAEKLKADRIELCSNIQQKGITPSYGMIKIIKQKLTIPVFVMIRPRTGNFHYTKEEIAIMKQDIKICKQLKVDGVVFGVLTSDKKIDYKVVKQLVHCAKPMSVTFHKAIDQVKNPVAEVKKLACLGVDRILTSGTKTTALAGKDMINEMIKQAQDNIIIVVAGKVTKNNFSKVCQAIAAKEYHGKKIV